MKSKSTSALISALALILAACSAQVSVQPTGTPTTSPLPPVPTATPSATPGPSATPASGIPLNGLITNLNFNQSLAELANPLSTESSGISKTTDRFGRGDAALAFSGSNSYLKLKNLNINPSLLPTLTLGIWARYTGSNAQDSFQVISHDDGQYDRTLGLDKRTGTWGWSAFTGSTENFIIGGAPVTVGDWVFLTVSYDQPNHRAVLYVNGSKFSEGTADSGPGFEYTVLGANPGYGENFTGDIDDFYVYNRVLSATEVQQIYTVTRSNPQ